MKFRIDIVIIAALVVSSYSPAQTFLELNGGGVIPNANSFANAESTLGYSFGVEYGFKFDDHYSLSLFADYSVQSIRSAISTASVNLLDQAISNADKSSLKIYSIGISHISSYEQNHFLTPFIRLSVGYNFINSPSKVSNEVNTVLFAESNLAKNFNGSIGLGFFIPVGNSNNSLGVEGDYNVIFKSTGNLNLFGVKVLYRTML